MKQVVFKRNDGYYMTTLKNYNAYIWDAQKIKKLHDVNTRNDAVNFIEKMCDFYNDEISNYSIID